MYKIFDISQRKAGLVQLNLFSITSENGMRMISDSLIDHNCLLYKSIVHEWDQKSISFTKWYSTRQRNLKHNKTKTSGLDRRKASRVAIQQTGIKVKDVYGTDKKRRVKESQECKTQAKTDKRSTKSKISTRHRAPDQISQARTPDRVSHIQYKC